MNELDDLEKRLKDAIKQSNDALQKISNLNQAVPYIQKYKDAKEISLKIVQGLPKDIAEELSPTFLTWENENEKILKPIFPAIPNISPLLIQAFDSSSGSATPYITNASTVILGQSFQTNDHPEWIDHELFTINEYSHRIQQSQYLPTRLDKINHDLGKMYKIANESYIKCKNKMISVDQSAMQMRNVIQQVWGGLVSLANQINKDPNVNLKHLKLKKEGDRNIIASLLATELFPKLKLNELLTEASILYINLSDSEFGKNILGNDFDRLDIYYSQWIAILDGISGITI